MRIAKMILCTLISGCILVPSAYCADAAKKEAVTAEADNDAAFAKNAESMAASRMRALLSLQATAKAINLENSGWNAVGPKIYEQYQNQIRMIDAARQKEAAKASDLQRADYITELNAARAAVDDLWNKQNRNNQILTSAYQELSNYYNGANTLYNQYLIGLDATWIRQNLNPVAMTSMYDAIDAESKRISGEYTKLMESYNQQLKVWEDQSKRFSTMIEERQNS